MQVASPQNGGKDKRDCGLCDRGRVASVICKSVGGQKQQNQIFSPISSNFLTLVETACEKINLKPLISSVLLGLFLAARMCQYLAPWLCSGRKVTFTDQQPAKGGYLAKLWLVFQKCIAHKCFGNRLLLLSFFSDISRLLTPIQIGI